MARVRQSRTGVRTENTNTNPRFMTRWFQKGFIPGESPREDEARSPPSRPANGTMRRSLVAVVTLRGEDPEPPEGTAAGQGRAPRPTMLTRARLPVRATTLFPTRQGWGLEVTEGNWSGWGLWREGSRGLLIRGPDGMAPLTPRSRHRAAPAPERRTVAALLGLLGRALW